MRFKASIIQDPANNTLSNESYIQCLFDNADHNTATIDGGGTFHAMGVILVVTSMKFISHSASDYNTVYTTLVELARLSQPRKQKFIFVTYDQPLYIKAREILACVEPANDPENLSLVIVRLGGFHLLMSFLGSIGFIFDGSRLREAFCEMYAETPAD